MLPPDSKKHLSGKAASETTLDHSAHSHAGRAAVELAGPPVPPAVLSAAPSLSTIGHAFRRKWPVAVPVALLGAFVAAVVACLLVPGQYTSVVVFRVLTRPPQGSLEGEENFVNVQKAQVALLKSHEVLTEAIQKSRATELYGVNFSVRSLQKQLVAVFNEGPEVLSVSLSEDNPEAAAALLAALGEVYPQRVAATEETRIKARIAQLRRRLVFDPDTSPGRQPTLAEQLRDKRIELRQAEQKAGLYDAETLTRKHENANAALQNAKRDLRDRRLQRDALEGEVFALENRLDKPTLPLVSEAEAEDASRNELDYQDLMKDISEKRKKIDLIRKVGNLNDPMVRKGLRVLRDELAKREQERADYLEVAKKKVARRLMAQGIEKTRKDVSELKDKIEQYKKQEASLEAEVRRCTIEVELFRAGGPKAPPEIEALRDQVQMLEKEQTRIGEELAGLQGSLPIQPRVIRHSDSFVPTERDFNRTIKVSLASSVGIFGLLLVGVCLLEARGRRVCTSDEVLHGLGLRVLGILPRVPSSAGRKAVGPMPAAPTPTAGGEPGSAPLTLTTTQLAVTDAVDAVRTILLHSPTVDGARVVMITSAAGGEGKTTLAGHLAASLSRAWRKTLLIDGDLRNPGQHGQFDQPLDPGFSELLRGEIEIEDAVKPTRLSRLWLMPAGKVDGHALEALAQEGVGGVFDRLKQEYDFIVLDTSPVLPVPDALVLGKQADVVMLSVMKDVSRLPNVYGAQQRLESLDIHVLGAVVIGEKTETYGRPVSYPRAGG
jgi:capsular exopolysaccharide synthesis family protein